MQITVGTYNIGSNQQDYHLKQEYLQQDDPTRDYTAEMNRAHLAAAKALQQQDVSILCLQETCTADRSFFNQFNNDNYEQVRYERARVHDGAIILDRSKFDAIENLSGIYGMDQHVIALATCRNGPKVLIATDHIPGFSYADPNQDAREIGYLYTRNLMSHLQELALEHEVEHIIVGADMNGDPKIAPDRFSLINKAGLQVFRSGQATNVHLGDGETHDQRELDYILAQGFKPGVATIPEAFDKWTAPVQASDHRPVVSTLEFAPRNKGKWIAGILAGATLGLGAVIAWQRKKLVKVFKSF